MLALEDLKDMTEAEVMAHLVREYAPETDDGQEKVAEDLKRFSVLVAYESVGSYGCDSSSWFLLRENTTGKLFEFSGSHCSCHGFEGQYEPEETVVEYLLSEKFNLPCGGYDDNEENNQTAVKSHLAALTAMGLIW